MIPKLPLSVGRCVAALLFVCAARVCAQPEYTVVADPISYASWAADAPRMNAAWSQNTGNAPFIVAEPAPSTNRTFAIANGVIQRPLDVTLTEEFDLSVDILHGAFARGIWIGMFNAAGTEGYGFLWDSGATGSQGSVSLRRFSVTSPSALVFNSYGTAIGSSTASGRSPVDGPFAHFRLTWNRSTATLKLFVDGVEKLSRTDATFSAFSRLFVSGNGTSALPAKFDNVTVSVRDGTPPVVMLTAPAEGAALSGVVRLSAEASDNLGVAGVQFKLDGADLGAEVAQAPYAIDWDTDAVAPGTHTLTAVARDRGGNTATSAAVLVSVAGHAQLGAIADTQVQSGASQERNYGRDTRLEAGRGTDSAAEERELCLRFDLGETVNVGRGVLRLYGATTSGAVTLEVRSSDNVHWNELGTRWVNRPDTGAAQLAVAEIQPTPAWHEWDVTAALQAAKHTHKERVTLIVRGLEGGAGLASFHSREHEEHSPQLLVIPDRTPPTIAIRRPLDGAVVSRRVPVSAEAADNRAVAGVQFQLDGVALGDEQTSAPFGLIWDSESVASGAHTLTAVVRDAAGNRVTSAPVQITVARTLPAGSVIAFEAEALEAMSGVTPGLDTVTGLHDGDWIRFNAVDLTPRYLTFQARVASTNPAADYGELELRLGAPDGERIAVLRVLNTGDASNWEVQTAAISGGTGTQDLYLVARGGNGASVAALDWIKLRRDMLPRGATMPFVTYEAESGTSTGTLNGSNDLFHRYAASGRAYVWLAATGQSVQWTAQLPANRLTLRYGIPQGANGTITVSVNNVPHTVPLTWAQCYDASAITTKPRRYDEATLAVDIAPGDVVRVEKDSTDALAWYAIDLIDLELAPAPASAPADFVSAADFPRLAGETHDGPRIQRCLNAANGGTKKAFLPAGNYLTSTRLIIPAGVELRGAGLWHTTLHNPTPGADTANVAGFFIGSDARLSDLKITGVATQRSNGVTSVRSLANASGFTIENVHIQNMGDLMGWEIFRHATFRNCRLIGTYFDGIHFGDDAVTDCLVDNCFFRGAGDDHVAQVNRADMGLATRNVVQFVTAVAQYHGRGIANIGGDDFTVRDSIFDGTFHAGVMIATEPLGPSSSRPIQGFKVQRCTVMQTVHPASVLPSGSNHGAIHFWLPRNPVRDVRIEDCTIVQGETRAIRVDNTSFGDELGRTQFNYNVVGPHPLGGLDNASTLVVPVLTGNSGL